MHRLVSCRGCSLESLSMLFNHLLPCLRDTPLDGCHVEVIFLSNGCHVPNNNHLITWRIDTTSIGDLRCDAVERWSLGGVDRHQQHPASLLREYWLRPRGGLDLTELACSAREALLLPISCSSGLILVPLSCMLVLQSLA